MNIARNTRVAILLTEDEKNELVAGAKHASVQLGPFIRMKALEAVRETSK